MLVGLAELQSAEAVRSVGEKDEEERACDAECGFWVRRCYSRYHRREKICLRKDKYLKALLSM